MGILMNKIIFQYCRVSTSEQQSHGMGLENQKLQNDNAIKRLMEDDPSLVRGEDIIEVGSAFSGNNFTEVLSKVANGQLPKDSIVVLMDETRFTREDPLDALIKLRSTVRDGLNFYFSSKSKMITPDNVNSFTDYVVHLATGAASHEESKNRSNRTKTSFNRKVESGEYIYSGHQPVWINKVYKEGKIVGIKLNEERANIIKLTLEKYLDGMGTSHLVSWLNGNFEPWEEFHNRTKSRVRNQNARLSEGREVKMIIRKKDNGFSSSFITRLLRDRRLLGERKLHKWFGKDLIEKEEIIVPDYYPRVIDDVTFYQIQSLLDSRNRQQVMVKHPPIFFIGISYCGYCGGKIVGQQFKTKRSAVRCSQHAKKETDQCAGGSSPSRFLEQVLIELCSDEVNYELLFEDKKDGTGLLKSEIVVAEGKVKSLGSKLTKLEDLYFEEEISKARYIARKGNIETDYNNYKSELVKLNGQLDQMKNSKSSITEIEEFKELVEMVNNGDLTIDMRVKLRDLLPKFIARIDIYRYGDQWKSEKAWAAFTNLADQELIDHVLENRNPFVKDRSNLSYNIIFKNGASRFVAFNYKTENWTFTATGEGGTWA